ncbi:hypothetical protein LTS14_001683 [Recurvomyces mirabilis]|nr:hypothetical protein LTS14_001683 [Recurvomyces mirabilis]
MKRGAVHTGRHAAHRTSAKLLQLAKHILPLRKTSVTAKSSAALHNAMRATMTNVSLTQANQGGAYAIDIDFGGQTFTTIFDTGSSDLWLAQQDVQCVEYLDKVLQPAACTFGLLAPDTFEDGTIDNENFYIIYGDGEELSGVWGYEDVSIGGLSVPYQQVALVDSALWNGDNVTSGLIGFAYPALTSAYPGNESAIDDPNSTIPYNPWIFNAITRDLIDPIFSLAIQRGSNNSGGQLALGGLPPSCHNLTYTSTDLHISDLANRAGASTNFSFYSIIPDGFKAFGDRGLMNRRTNYSVIVDSGTTLVYLPPLIASKVNALYDPPSKWIPETASYENLCNAVPPSFAITIDGTDLWISSDELLMTGEAGEDPETGGCFSGIQPSFDGAYILGEVFLKNVVAAFDIGNSQMHFAQHEY